MSRAVTVRLPLTCGELVQGTVDGIPVLVSAPIARWGEVRLAPGAGLVTPRGTVKLRQALTAAGASDVQVTVRREARAGAGYATSTADVAGGLAAWGLWCDAPFPPETLARQAVEVEPSDGTMFPGLALFAHRDATLIEPLGPAPRLPLLLLDPGGTLDTVWWTRRLPHVALDASTGAALADLRHGLATGDLEAIGRAATRSAASYQPVLPSALVTQALALAPAVRALGVVRAHSGSIAGLLFADEASAQAAWRRVAAALPDCAVDLTMLVDGGVVQERGDYSFHHLSRENR
ncbi:MAG: hypothetical protein M5U01_20265 [Ardenticatenaceae bacterium]|nr:hypothetical protein [Ardenticatenaceae bacterium]